MENCANCRANPGGQCVKRAPPSRLLATQNGWLPRSLQPKGPKRWRRLSSAVLKRRLGALRRASPSRPAMDTRGGGAVSPFVTPARGDSLMHDYKVSTTMEETLLHRFGPPFWWLRASIAVPSADGRRESRVSHVSTTAERSDRNGFAKQTYLLLSCNVPC